MTAPSVVVVVVAYGPAIHLPATLRSIAAQDYPGSLQCIVVDNGGGSAALAQAVARAPDTLLLQPPTNLGFGGGCNLAVQHSRAAIVVLINPDVTLRPGFLQALAGALAEPGTGIAGAKLLFPDGRTVQHAGGLLDLPLGLTSHRGYHETDGPAYDMPTDVPYVTGAALAIWRDTWEHLGGCDERFWPAYYEEVDLCLRARAQGLRVCYVPAAVAEHQETSALGRSSVAYHRLYHANRLRLLFKHWDDRWLVAKWLPAELRHLRTTAGDHEIAGLLWSYRIWQVHFAAGNTGVDARLDGWQEPAAQEPPPGSELAWTLRQAANKREIRPRPFTSSLPGVARLRGWLNRLATEAYLRPLIQQQNDFNASLVELTTALERQRRTADGAVLCQGVLLAKLLARRVQ